MLFATVAIAVVLIVAWNVADRRNQSNYISTSDAADILAESEDWTNQDLPSEAAVDDSSEGVDLTSIQLANELEAYLADNFFSTTWYPSIGSIDIEGSSAVVSVNEPGDAEQVCGAVSGWVYANNGPPDIGSVEISGPGGEIILARRSLSDTCY
jgi:hypothetical protein